MKLSREFKIGLVTTLTLAVFIWGLNFLKGLNMFSPTNSYYLIYSNVKALKESDYVLLSGMKVGMVSGIEMDPVNNKRVIVKILVDKEIKIPADTRAILFSRDIMDTKAIKLEIGKSSQIFEHNDTIKTSYVPGLTESIEVISDKAVIIVSNLDTAMNNLKEISRETEIQKLQNTISNFEKITNDIASITDPGSNLNNTLRDLSDITGNIKDQNHKIDGIISNIDTFSNNINQWQLDELIDSTLLAITSVQNLLSDINEGKGTLGSLVSNDSLYTNLNNATNSLDLLLKDLKDNPKRYIHFSIFGKKDK